MSRGAPLFQRAVALLVRLSLSAVARIRVEGLEHVPRGGPLIVVANHVSNADPPLVGAFLLPALGRPLHWLAKEPLFRGPVGAFLRAQRVYPVRAGGSDVDAYRTARGVLERGGVMIIFPEGTRSPDGRLSEARPGVALLAWRTGVPVLPVGVVGAQRFLSRGARLPRFGAPLAVRVGPPFLVELDRSLPRRKAVARATDALMGRIAALLPPEQRGRYVPPPRRATKGLMRQ